MQSRLRPRTAAAAFLLAAVGAGFVAPASAHIVMGQPHHHSPQELIQRFELIGQPVRGVVLTYRVTGVPGSNVRLRNASYPQEIQLKEVQPGVYEVEYVIAPNEDPRNVLTAVAHAVSTEKDEAVARLGGFGTLSPGAVAVPTPPRPPVVAPRDNRGPDIASVSPAQGERVSGRGRTRIEAHFGDDRSGVDPNSVRLRVDGRDVTRDSRIDGNGIQYRDDLAPGRHSVELTVRDRAGNTSRRSWTFDVVDTRPGYGWGDRNHEHERRYDDRQYDDRRW